MDFKVVDSDVGLNRIPIAVRRVATYCDKMKDGDLISTRGLADSLSCSFDYLSHVKAHQYLTDYRTKWPGKGLHLLWGNKKTIAQLKKTNGSRAGL